MPTKLVWTNTAWSDYVYWQGQDKKTLKRINLLIKKTMRSPENGIGKPKAPKENLSCLWSRRIDDVNRLVYTIEKDPLVIIACRYDFE
jgi:toxin YoeB